MSKFTRYMIHSGIGLKAHACGLLYKRDDVDPEIERLTAEPTEPRQPTVQEAAKVLLNVMRQDDIDEHVMRCFWQGSPFSALRALAEGDSQ